MTKTEQIFKLSAPFDNMCQGKIPRYLFVCSAGLLRSPTAAAVATQMGRNARSCGSARYALIPLSVNLIHWAHTIFFVNEENSSQALETFGHIDYADEHDMLLTKGVVWDIPDTYNYMEDPLPAIVREFLLAFEAE